MMRESVIRNSFLLYLLLLSNFSHADEINEKTLEKNTERMRIENYYKSGEAGQRKYAIVFVYCNDNYYEWNYTNLNSKNIGFERYFLNVSIKDNAIKIPTKISEERLPVNDFILKYLSKKDGENYYNVPNIKELFFPIEEILSILFAAQYNYDFLILGENDSLNLYLPNDYPNINKSTTQIVEFPKIILFYIILILGLVFFIFRLRRSRSQSRSVKN